MEIRPAEVKDLFELDALGLEFALASQKVHGCTISLPRIQEFSKFITGNPNWVFLVLVVEDKIQGFILGVRQRIYFSEEVVLQELAWYVRPNIKGGMMLLTAFEKAAVAMGCQKLVVGNKPGYYDLSSVYHRRKFRLLENHYMKDI